MITKRMVANSEYWGIVEKIYDFILCFNIETGDILRKSGFDKVCTELDSHTDYYKLMAQYRSDYINGHSVDEFKQKTSLDYLLTNEVVRFIGLENVENGEKRWYDYTLVVDGEIGTMLIQDIHEIHSKFLELEEKSTLDYLTGTLNRMSFDDLVDSRLNEIKKFAILFVDIDNFKLVNDTHGHSMGDCVLKEIAAILKNALPSGTMISRYGGDEFTVCIDGVGEFVDIKTDIDALLVQIKDELKCGVKISISIGISFYPTNGVTRKMLFHTADLALYDAKRRGKKTYRVAGEV